MDPITIAMIAGGMGLSLLGNAVAAGDDAKARAILQEVSKQYGPEYAQQIAAIKAPHLGPSAVAGLQNDPTGRNAQLKALSQLEDTINQGGQTAGDRAVLAQAENAAAARASGDAATQMQNLAQRGQANSPAAAMLQMQAGQTGANVLGSMANDAAQAAMQRRLSAIEASGQLGGQLSGQDWQHAMDKAQAADSINQWNANMSWQAQQERDQLDAQRRQGYANAQQGVANSYTQGAQGTRQAFAGAGNGMVTAGSAYGQSQKPRPPHQNPDGTWS